MNLDSKVWGPHYWFVLYSIAITYPNTPNNVTKKKYYEFIQNLPLFLPHDEISNYFSNMINKYPVTPYLDSRDSFTKWIHFIHNRINVILNKPEITLKEAYQNYHDSYKPKIQKNIENILIKKKYIYSALFFSLISFTILLYNE
jgi:hypothetical protein|tara:strand:+ start:1920 stop:2351 length:432 start_codon:yes stop_codon:yes gene_type:complete